MILIKLGSIWKGKFVKNKLAGCAVRERCSLKIELKVNFWRLMNLEIDFVGLLVRVSIKQPSLIFVAFEVFMRN